MLARRQVVCTALTACTALAALVACAALIACAAPSPLLAALAQGDTAAARGLIDRGAALDATDGDGNTAVMLATWHGDAALVAQAIARGADVRHHNAAGTTALHWAVDDLAKVRALLDAGADPDAADDRGVAPLMLAAARDDGGPVVELLLARGADPTRVRTSLGAGDPRSLRALLSRGVDPRNTPAALNAAAEGNAENLAAVIARGASPNTRGTLLGVTPLMWAAQMGRSDAVGVLLARGADPDLRETFNGSTALMQAAASDRAGPSIVAALLAARADAAIVDDEGATALDWALRRGDPEIIQMIAAREIAPRPPRLYQASGARVGAGNTPGAAIARAVPLLEASRAEFRRKSGCPSCHHDAFAAMALTAASARGAAIDAAARDAETRATALALRPSRARYLLGTGFADVVEPAYLLVGLAADRYPRDELTDAMTRYLELAQSADGRWATQMQRTPMDGSDVAFTAMAIRALSIYDTAAAAARIARGRAWLAAQSPVTTEDRAFQLLGLRWAGASPAELGPALGALAATQRSDGGFAQRPALHSDPYATSQAIVALRRAGDMPASDPAIAHAIGYLLAQQFRDGSWFVATRALRFQPFFDSGFPHGRSQYISAAATAWAVLALADGGP